MMLMKKLSSKEVLEVLASMAVEDIPEGIKGNLHLQYDDDNGVEIFFVENSENTTQA